MRVVRFTYYDNGVWIIADGYFHAWGTECIESSGGNVTYSVGIIEADSGSIFTVQPKDITFLTKYDRNATTR